MDEKVADTHDGRPTTYKTPYKWMNSPLEDLGFGTTLLALSWRGFLTEQLFDLTREPRSNMPLELRPAVDADMYRAAVIEREAYSPLETNTILFPGPFPPDVLHYRAAGWKKQAQAPGTSCFKVVDTELPAGEEQIIAFSQW